MTEGLDFSGLSDNQLLSLLQELIAECLRRGPATTAAAEAARIEAAERARILNAATSFEVARLRTEERARIARQARAEAVEILARERQDAERTRQAQAAAAAAERRRETIRRMAMLLGRDPASISIHVADTRRGRRVIVNEGTDRYATQHLVDYQIATGKISTTRDNAPKKRDLSDLCAEIAAGYPAETSLVGRDLR